jgi:hypothetical protein
MSRYKEGDILKPINSHTLQHTKHVKICKVQVIPVHRLEYYSEDNSVKEIYHVHTDCGHTFPLTQNEIDSRYEVVEE